MGKGSGRVVRPERSTVKIVIPMAGSGQRFVDAGYTTWKPHLPLQSGQRIIDAVMDTVRPTRMHSWVIIHPDMVGGKTAGTLCTILKADSQLEWKDELLVANNDQLVDINIDDFLAYAEQFDGCVMTFDCAEQDPKWCYVKTVDGRITEIAEKEPISTEAIVGIYYFRTFGAFQFAARSVIMDNERTKGEFYLSLAIKRMLENHHISTYKIRRDQFHGLGTPQDYEAYLKGSAF